MKHSLILFFNTQHVLLRHFSRKIFTKSCNYKLFKNVFSTNAKPLNSSIEFPFKNIVLKTREFYLDKGKASLIQHGYKNTEINDLIVKLHRHLQLSVELDLLEILIKENQSDNEALQMCQNEQNVYNQETFFIENEIVDILCAPFIPTMNKIMLEVKAGAGGQEAMLFTSEIFQMYESFVRFKNWQCDIVNYDISELGGLRHATMLISGSHSFNCLQFEGGVHRVQRVPKTEKSGRLHTSTMTVAVLQQPTEVQINLHDKDLKIETCKASGKGGQHVNTTDSAVRIVHLPTGIVAECQVERSQQKNKEIAIQILRTRIFEQEQNKITHQIDSNRKLQIGSANRNEKIRTYNFKDDRVTDHRISKSIFGIKSFLSGNDEFNNLVVILNEENKKELILDIMAKLTGKPV